MGSAMLKLIVLSVCLNLFLYLGVNFAIFENTPKDQRPELQDDLFSILFTDEQGTKDAIDNYVDGVNTGENYTTDYVFDVKANFSNPPNDITGSSILVEQGGFAFLDVARTVKAFIVTLWRIAFMPIALFSYNLLPPIAAAIIAIPLFILNITTLIIFLRGGGAV